MRLPAAALAAVLLLAGCGGDPDSADDPGPTSSSPTPTSPAAYPLEDRCTGQGGTGESVFWTADDGSVLSGATFGEGDRAAVLLHQNGLSGLCGWVPYAAWAAEKGVRLVLLELCGYGRSTCTDELDADPEAQLRFAVDEARSGGATSVVVVGASMGGSVALGVGEAAGADAVVDISGPADWQDVPSAEEALPAASVPALLMFARDDSPEDWRRLRAAARGTDAEFVDVPGAGHGYTIVTDGTLVDATITRWGEQVLGFIRRGGGAAR